MGRLRVEVVHATAALQEVVAVEVDPGSTVLDAFNASGLGRLHAAIAAEGPLLGIFGKKVPPGTPVRDGDRVEVYRPLRADPKSARRAKASRSRATSR